MGRLVLTAALFWVFLIPTLCLAGVFNHLCSDCTVESCSHEDDCSDDPCSTILGRLQPAPRAAGIAYTSLATPARPPVTGPAQSPGEPPAAITPKHPKSAFPLHQSDRPLLI